MTTDFVYMAFPKRTFDGSASYGFDGNSIQLFSTAYVCPRCYNRTSEIPTQCCVCKVQLNSSSHIARSHHHLFPVPNYNELNLVQTSADKRGFHAYRLHDALPEKELGIKKPNVEDELKRKSEINDVDDLVKKIDEKDLVGIITHCKGCLEEFNSSSLAMHCPTCDHIFCIECDLFIHNSLHNCPGCI